jgi:hypothetical protein
MRNPTLTRRRNGGIGFDRVLIDLDDRTRLPRWAVGSISAAIGFLAGVGFVLMVAP